MALTDTAEYWNDIKSRVDFYTGRRFKHIPNSTCGHLKTSGGNVHTTPYIGDINCFACIEIIKNGFKDGLRDGKAPETYYMSKREKKRFNARKLFNQQHGICPCGCDWTIRKNSNTQVQFLGCVNYPKCKNTKTIELKINE